MRLIPGKREQPELPLLPLKETFFFPGMLLPLVITRDEGKAAIRQAMESDRKVLAVAQKNPHDPPPGESPSPEMFHPAGTIVHIVQLMKMPDGAVRVMLEGQERVTRKTTTLREGLFLARTEAIVPDRTDPEGVLPKMVRVIQDTFKEYAILSGVITTDIQRKVAAAESADRIADLVAGYVSFDGESRLQLLQERSTVKRVRHVSDLLNGEVELLKLKRSIKDRVRRRLEKNQRDYFLQEQIRELNKELGEDSSEDDTLREIKDRLTAKAVPQAVSERVTKEMDRLRKLPPVSPESGIIRTYVDWLLDLPWEQAPREAIDIHRAAEILDEDHYDMRKPKDRLLEYIAVHSLNPEIKSPILCFVGPPGTGKTSLGRSVARALGRAFVRLSLGGVRDEAEIRGHRRTYVGALPGRIIQAMKRAEEHNPVILLDEIDKIGTDFRGDPSSALLEVLDPEQNGTFSDHYIEIPFDLSQVTFLTTANSLHTIPAALRDRLEIIEIPGYTEPEKRRIARDFLIPEQIRENGLGESKIVFRKDAITTLITEYTTESGVRSLKREIASVTRKLARELLEEGTPPEAFTKTLGSGTINRLLGPPRYRHDLERHDENPPGRVQGLAWTETGGVLLSVEAALLKGPGEMVLTGSLGDVMKESARIALSRIVSGTAAAMLNFDRTSQSIHIHVPQGAIPKDGPSAGITVYTALYSLLKGVPVGDDLAMTGELTLTGRVLPVGGIKEKLLAAQRRDISRVILPRGNQADVEILSRENTRGLDFFYVDQVDQIIPIAFPDGDAVEEPPRDADSRRTGDQEVAPG
ncbi:hypothetical protein AU468_13070 [Alkalispirochaeta sphaeroplastigenens]|uniref:Lon protease n=1 Tax=Alkalispirochaeta sphaeroplastigenens TaxID=1187066 RepID=A0A2S4JGC5_9SPIO|nr:endopeptidase La [Alkalispirochaeta sphaeroplastigenens]POQ98515.1 hypothetical protein AU468_13070 [Alkalispirochaeta sphaeroplastigenens]